MALENGGQDECVAFAFASVLALADVVSAFVVVVVVYVAALLSRTSTGDLLTQYSVPRN